jgi:hypothetical protein
MKMTSIELLSNIFIFANNLEKDICDSYFENFDNFLSKNNALIFFNRAIPLIKSNYLSHHSNKWLFFRLLANHKNYNSFFYDLGLLKNFQFTKYFFIPEPFEQKWQNRNFFIPTINELHNRGIDIKNFCHMSLFDGPELRMVKKIYPKNKTISSGLWLYLYLKYHYSTSKFYLVNFNSKVNSDFHSPEFESAYLCSEYMNNACTLLEFD